MNEKSNKKREWVKTAAIVFLSVLLVLTFFSNTIMNYSLPEVATQYVESGTITAKIRGTGVVESGDPYSVKLKTTGDTTATGVYEVQSVEVRRGDIVQKGDALCYLASSENTELKALRKQWDEKVKDVELSILEGKLSSSVLEHIKSGNLASIAAYQNQVQAKDAEIAALEDELEEAEDTLAAWKEQQSNGGTPNTTKEQKKVDEAQAAYDEVADEIKEIEDEIENKKKLIKQNEDMINNNLLIVNDAGEQVPAVTEVQKDTAKKNNDKLKSEVENLEVKLKPLKEEKLPPLEKALKKAKNALNNKLNSSGENVEDQISNWTKEVASRGERLDDAKESKARLIDDLKMEQEFAKLQEQMAEQQGESVNGVVTAPVSGSIIDVNVKSGEDTPGNGILFTIQPEGKGYTMQFTVTNEQARRLSVGDEAELVNSWRYDDVNVVLSNIKPDPQNPNQNKLLTFDISGEVTAGQSLNVSVGQRSANYDLTVPNSAIREDNNGKFILTVETKSTPLSNRYIATRVDVEVLGSDDNRSAISAPLYGYEYVITTSTAPVEAGKQVRLANN
ncbi:MAG: HlyD family efflux transporter periplasmic adaptor subunit [Muribaculum sp.]|nr:HlyD family efflux transporter periplasmic adaptor subunit [Muribaculum sp.]